MTSLRALGGNPWLPGVDMKGNPFAEEIFDQEMKRFLTSVVRLALKESEKEIIEVPTYVPPERKPWYESWIRFFKRRQRVKVFEIGGDDYPILSGLTTVYVRNYGKFVSAYDVLLRTRRKPADPILSYISDSDEPIDDQGVFIQMNRRMGEPEPPVPEDSDSEAEIYKAIQKADRDKKKKKQKTKGSWFSCLGRR